jgi:hypothetical protein
MVHKSIRIVAKYLRLITIAVILCLTVIVIHLLFIQQRPSVPRYLELDQVWPQKSDKNGNLPELMPRSESIFFVETAGNSVVQLRQLCVVESAAKYHPITQVIKV